MRKILLVAALGWASPVLAASGPALDPYATVIRFSPFAPPVVATDHPLYQQIAVEPVMDMPNGVGSFMISVAKRKDMDAALTNALASANMLAPSPANAKARLRVHWQSFELPFKIGVSSKATVAIRYELVRIADNRIVFAKDIVTEAEARGGDGSKRALGTGRAAISANIASILHCMDLGSTGPTPDDCTLRPSGSFATPVPKFRYVYVRRRR